MPEQNIAEKIEINGKILQYGVLSTENGKGYQVYLYPGMTVAEIAFNVMVTIRLLEQEGYINKKEFDTLVTKYYADPQYFPLGKGE
jgi:hypothetical protein